MRISRPEINHPPEIYEAIIRECGRRPMRLGELLQACGWPMVDAAWMTVNWDLPTLAAALANERAKRHTRLTTLSDAEVVRIKAELDAEEEKKVVASPPPKNTPRVVRTSCEFSARPATKPAETKQ